MCVNKGNRVNLRFQKVGDIYVQNFHSLADFLE